MMNSLTLMNTGSSTLQFAVFLAINLLAGLLLLRRKRMLDKAAAYERHSRELTMSAFSAFSAGEHLTLLRDEVDVNPLTEAEIYVIYGRKKDAQLTLDSAMRDGRISAEQVVRFWSEHQRA